MDQAWQRRRNPDDVPTPVAVAVSDFCRRAGAASSPAEVREALSLLSEEEDFRARSLADSEPEARPLGPFAVIDVLRGAEQDLAALRQDTGYYDLAKRLVRERERTSAGPLPAPAPVATPAPAPAPPAPEARKKRERKAAPPTVAERIAPRRRGAKALPAAALEEVPALEPGRARERPLPKGRFSNVTPARETVEALFRPEARALLQERVAQHPDRFALTRALAETYGGKREGQPLRTEDLERALHHHGLLDPLEAKEREAVLGAYSEQRGATGKVAFQLGLSVPELNRLVKALGLKQDVEVVRERFRREALSGKRLGARLDLLGRGKYLSDLGIRRRFDDQLRADLKKLFDQHAQAATPEELFDAIARREGTHAELLARAAEKLGITPDLHQAT